MKKIFYNGTIITMEAETYVDAVLINNDIIEKIGSFDELQITAPDALLINLNHKTMLPAFIDAHSHLSSYASAQLQISLDNATSFNQISAQILSFINSNNIQPGQWIIANGYDQNILAEKTSPTKELLDALAPNNPLVLQHKSRHCGVFNSKALELLLVTSDTIATSSGVIACENDRACENPTCEGPPLTGYMEENAYIECIKKIPIPEFKSMIAAYSKAQEKYLSYGITTVQEGMMVTQMLPIYKSLISNHTFIVDVIGYSDISSMPEITAAFPNSLKKYNSHFKIGGYKIFLDGSPQLKTAWMKLPYKNSKDSNNNSDYCGCSTMSDSDVFSAVKKSALDNIQILAHCNGDAAIQQYINAVKKVTAENPNTTSLKPVIIHSQLITKEQLAEVSKLNMIPSFFVAHVLYWGDTHIENFGYNVAQSISPANSTLNNSITFTFHQDAPVIEPNMLETIQCAVIRKTKAGITLGKHECISVVEALKAVTINAAYQYSEENTKGSIKVGKHADFVIMSDNPITVPTDKITDISILETIKDGKTVFKSSQPHQPPQ